MFYLLDTYLNTPDKFLNETCLHFASKFGTPDILELFLSFPECDRDRINTKGETASDVIMSLLQKYLEKLSLKFCRFPLRLSVLRAKIHLKN